MTYILGPLVIVICAIWAISVVGLGRRFTTLVASKEAEKAARKSAPRVPKVKPWEDLQAGAEQQAPREGSALHTALELIKTHKGATLEEIQAAIGDKHIARRLLTWANRERGYGFVMTKNSQKIQALAPNLRQPKVVAQPAAN